MDAEKSIDEKTGGSNSRLNHVLNYYFVAGA